MLTTKETVREGSVGVDKKLGSPIQREVAYIEELLGVLSSGVSNLEERLEPISDRGAPIRGGMDQSAEDGVLSGSPLVNTMRSWGQDLVKLRERLNHIEDQLDV